jgi:hypothetical protein
MFKTIIFSIITIFQAYGSELNFPSLFTWRAPQIEITTIPQLPSFKINLDLLPKTYTPKPKISERK